MLDIRCALFDFDGTISLIREGWQDIMIPYFTEVLSETPAEWNNPSEGLAGAAREFIDILTGKATIYQCLRLVEEVEKRGGVPLDPREYKAEYLRRLGLRIKSRLDRLRGGDDPTPFIVPGARELLKGLREEGIRLYLASGTDHGDVCEEAKLLGVFEFFDGGVYGATDDVEGSSKAAVISRIIREYLPNGEHLIGFGDGYVEIENVVEAGGYAIGVATDERNIGKMDEWKEARLIRAGAGKVIPDFSHYEELISIVRQVRT